MSKGSSRNGREPKARRKTKPMANAAASQSLRELGERVGRIADEVAALVLGIDGPSGAVARTNAAVSSLWAAEGRIKEALALLTAGEG